MRAILCPPLQYIKPQCENPEAFSYLQILVPDLEEAIPGPCCHCHAIVSHTQAAHPVIMTSQDACEHSEDSRKAQQTHLNICKFLWGSRSVFYFLTFIYKIIVICFFVFSCNCVPHFTFIENPDDSNSVEWPI